MDSILIERFSGKTSASGPFLHILPETGKDVFDFLSPHLSGENGPVYEINEKDTCDDISAGKFAVIINKQQLNIYPDVNRYFLAVNKGLQERGVFISSFECYESQKHFTQEMAEQPSTTVNVDSFIKPLSGIRNAYRVRSLAETFGRAVYCGFEIIDFRFIGNLTWFVVRKKVLPEDRKDPVFRMIIRLNRVGKDGIMFRMYKVRTMYPYSEYIQDYIVKINGLNLIGKPDKDFRLMRIGRMIRKVWIDEIPQIINLIKGDMNIIGVRPISKFLFDSYPEDLQKARIKYKPGLIPPQIALKEKGFAGVIRAERQYLSEMEKGPFRTNLKYLILAVFNIITFRIKTA